MKRSFDSVEMRLLSKSATGGATGVVVSWWSDRPSRIRSVFGCYFQPTPPGKLEGTEIRLRCSVVRNGEASGLERNPEVLHHVNPS